jgi:hypothetical protein
MTKERTEIVSDGKVFAIVVRPWGLLVVHRLPALFNPGTVSALVHLDNDRWIARPLLELPGFPEALRLEPDGGMAIATTKGTLWLNPKGTVERFECDEVRPTSTSPTTE